MATYVLTRIHREKRVLVHNQKYLQSTYSAIVINLNLTISLAKTYHLLLNQLFVSLHKTQT